MERRENPRHESSNEFFELANADVLKNMELLRIADILRDVTLEKTVSLDVYKKVK